MIDNDYASGMWATGDGWTGNDAPYDDLLSDYSWGSPNAQDTIILGDGDGDTGTTGTGLLTIGQQYEIQVWEARDTGGPAARNYVFASSSTDTTVSLNDQFAIGTFTADATTQTLFMQRDNGDDPRFNAYQIRAVPEPSTLALIGLVGMALVASPPQVIRLQAQVFNAAPLPPKGGGAFSWKCSSRTGRLRFL